MILPNYRMVLPRVEGDDGVCVPGVVQHDRNGGGQIGVQKLDGAGDPRLLQGHGHSRRGCRFKGEFAVLVDADADAVVRDLLSRDAHFFSSFFLQN